MWCHVTWCADQCHLMRCNCLCCIMSRDAMRCHVMCAHVKSCHLLFPAMGWNVMSLKRTYSLHNYSVLQRYYSSATPVLLCTTKDYSVQQSTTTPGVVHSPPVLLCTIKSYSNTTLYNEVYSSTPLQYVFATKYLSVLQRATLFLLCAACVPWRSQAKLFSQQNRWKDRIPNFSNELKKKINSRETKTTPFF